jgi:hypothetical protein
MYVTLLLGRRLAKGVKWRFDNAQQQSGRENVTLASNQSLALATRH